MIFLLRITGFDILADSIRSRKHITSQQHMNGANTFPHDCVSMMLKTYG